MQARVHFSGGAICPDCVKPTDGHIVCVGRHVWVCGACATQKKTLDSSVRCPRCKDCYCFYKCNMKYIGVCEDCQRSTLCNDCMELEDDEDDGHLPDEGAYLKSPVRLTVCERCDVSICADCFEERRFRVCCGRVCCRYCSGYDGECGTCGEAPMYQLPGARPQVARE
ncbi:hypothetical protein DEU56DRAFT_840114 [Suillus clintonianus]|uniref:uncharacterized protein n=1 Tax=Suillus clintonianus TaxID=1904413 RepID=UPI001B86DCA6|nr:uncharacterized protein DEU56DRAFT_840114 [Suillus clintonianus]KAG2116373.1 hypothetical protein DEU56DRAFT_840114 [Suillus clintonianus]